MQEMIVFQNTARASVRLSENILEEAVNEITRFRAETVLLSLQNFVREKFNIHARLKTDDTTAVACVSELKTSHSDQCNTKTVNSGSNVFSLTSGQHMYQKQIM